MSATAPLRHDFRIPVLVPRLGLGSCLLLFTRIDGSRWLRGLVLIGLGVVLAAVNLVRAAHQVGVTAIFRSPSALPTAQPAPSRPK